MAAVVGGEGGGWWLKCVEKSEEIKQCAHIHAILQSHIHFEIDQK